MTIPSDGDIKPNVVTIMLTGSKDSSLAIRLINEGRIFRYLIKPFRRQALKETLRVAVEQYNNPTTIETVARNIEHKRIFNGDSPKVQTLHLSDVIRRVNEKIARVGTY